MVAAKEPFFVVQLQQDLVEEEVQPVRLAQRQRSKIQEPAWGVVGQHIIYLPAVFFQRLFAAGIFLIRGHLLRPPVDPRLPFLFVLTFGPAEAEIFFALQRQHTAPADMVNIAAQRLDRSAEPLLGRVLGQQVVVLMAAIQKQQRVWAFAQPVQLFLFFCAAVPHEAEIAQHHHDVLFAQPAQPPVPEPVQIAVGVACQIYHSRPPVPERAKLQPKAAKPLSRPGKPVIIKYTASAVPFVFSAYRCRCALLRIVYRFLKELST